MAEPKQDTVRVALPQRPETTHGPQNDDARHETAQILLPSRAPAIPPRRSPPPSPVSTGPRAESPITPLRRPPTLLPRATASPILPLPKPAGAPPVSSEAETSANLPSPADAPAECENFAGVSVERGPKKETARMTLHPRPSVPAPALNVMKTQPLGTRPAIVQTSPVIVAPSSTIDVFDSIPRWFCWGLLGIAALIFLTQIWNYALS